MGHDDDAGAVLVAQIHELAHDLRLGGHVQGGGRLVGQQQPRLVGHAHGDAHALALAAGELEGIGVHDAVAVGQTHPLEHLHALVPGFLLGYILMGADVFHVAVADEPGLVHHGAAVLEDHGDVVAAQITPLGGGQPEKAAALVDDVAGCDLAAAGNQTEDGADDRGLARAGLAHDGADLPGMQIQTYVFDRDILPIGNINVFYFKQWHRYSLLILPAGPEYPGESRRAY